MNCLSVFDHFVILALKGLRYSKFLSPKNKKTTLFFNHAHKRNIEVSFIFIQHTKNPKKFPLFILEIQSTLEYRDKNDHTHFLPCQPKNFHLDFHGFVTACKNQANSLFFSGDIVALKIL